MKPIYSYMLSAFLTLTFIGSSYAADSIPELEKTVVKSDVSESEIKNITAFNYQMSDYKDTQWEADNYKLVLISSDKSDFQIFAFQYLAGNPFPNLLDATVNESFIDFDEPAEKAIQFLNDNYVVSKESSDKGLCLFNLLINKQLEDKDKRNSCYELK